MNARARRLSSATMRPIEHRQYLSRLALVRRGGAALFASSAVAAWLAGEAAAAAPDNDLAYLRLLIGAELLAADFQDQALASGKLDSRVGRARQADARRREGALQRPRARWSRRRPGARPPPTTSTSPTRRAASPRQASILKLALADRDAARSAPTSARSRTSQTPQLRLPIGQIAANEAQHVSALAAVRRPAGRSGARSRRRSQIDAVSAALDALRELTMPKQLYTASEAAAALGISLDTLRRWDKAGPHHRSSATRATAASSPPPRSTGCAATARARTSAPATASTAIVTDVKVDGLMAQVEMVVTRAGAPRRRRHPRRRRGARPEERAWRRPRSSSPPT